MIVLDSSAIVAVIPRKAKAPDFERISVPEASGAGAPPSVETRMLLEGRISAGADDVLPRRVADRRTTIVPFDAPIYAVAVQAFSRYGRGRRPCRLNIGDCLSYAVASVMRLPLLFKGDDFVHTDPIPAYLPRS